MSSRAAVTGDDDCFARVLGLGARRSAVASWLGFTSGGTVLFASLCALAVVAGWRAAVVRAAPAQEIEIEPEAPPPPPPPQQAV
ncbi:MAG: hypothetical protein ACRELB_02710, partial [Polyangiaceae bacterium]